MDWLADAITGPNPHRLYGFTLAVPRTEFDLGITKRTPDVRFPSLEADEQDDVEDNDDVVEGVDEDEPPAGWGFRSCGEAILVADRI